MADKLPFQTAGEFLAFHEFPDAKPFAGGIRRKNYLVIIIGAPAECLIARIQIDFDAVVEIHSVVTIAGMRSGVMHVEAQKQAVTVMQQTPENPEIVALRRLYDRLHAAAVEHHRQGSVPHRVGKTGVFCLKILGHWHAFINRSLVRHISSSFVNRRAGRGIAFARVSSKSSLFHTGCHRWNIHKVLPDHTAACILDHQQHWTLIDRKCLRCNEVAIKIKRITQSKSAKQTAAKFFGQRYAGVILTQC
ncbi:MAG: hypothetical protein ACD_39C00055G0001 [uncultured bacterium]|nr:MAG: hypothetical protein ACD_39C00055G0001 [uncultured bacterium]